MRTATLFTLLSTLALLCIALAMFSGAYPLSLRQVIGLLFSPDSPLPQDQIVFWQIRLPRIAAALLIGAALAGAGLGACVAIWLGLPLLLIQLLAFAGGLLVVPHIGRLLTGNNHQRLLPVAMSIGAILLLLTDTLARALSATEIPLGILTAFIGAPFFLLLLLRGGR